MREKGKDTRSTSHFLPHFFPQTTNKFFLGLCSAVRWRWRLSPEVGEKPKESCIEKQFPFDKSKFPLDPRFSLLGCSDSFLISLVK